MSREAGTIDAAKLLTATTTSSTTTSRSTGKDVGRFAPKKHAIVGLGRAIDGALRAGTLKTSGDLSAEDIYFITNLVNENLAVNNIGRIKISSMSQKWRKTVISSYKRAILRLNSDDHIALDFIKSHSVHKPNASVYETEDKLVQSFDSFGIASNVSTNPVDESMIEATLKCLRKNCRVGNVGLNVDVRMVKNEELIRSPNFLCKHYVAEIKVDDFQVKLITCKSMFTEKKSIEHIIRENFFSINNACGLNFKSLRVNKESFVAYGYCKDPSCNYFKFVGSFDGIVRVYSSSQNLTHTINFERNWQCRAINRFVAKSDIKGSSAFEYRTKIANKLNRERTLVGNKQMVYKNLSYYRNLISEENSKNDFEKDAFKDAYDMKCMGYGHFIQHISTRVEVYLWNLEHLKLFLDHIKISTLHIDATGCVVQPMKLAKKRIFLYSLVAHIPEHHIVYPVAHAILSNHTAFDIGRFLCDLNRFCVVNKLKLPLCKRVVTDVSFAIIGAVLKEYCDLDIAAYNEMCFRFLYSESSTFPKVCIQFCTSHYAKIMCADIDRTVGLANIDLRHFLRNALGLAYNICSIKDLEEWFKHLITILLSPTVNEMVSKAISYFTGAKPESFDLEKHGSFVNHGKKYREDTLKTIASKSRLKNRFNTFADVINGMVIVSENENQNIYSCPEMVEVILGKYIVFAPFWTNVLGIFIDQSNKRPSNGPIESFFKTLKHSVIKTKQGLKLGRFIHKMDDLSKSVVRQVELAHPEYIYSPILHGAVIKARPKKHTLKKMTALTEMSNKKLSKYKESWQKKGVKKLKVGLFKRDFSGPNKVREEYSQSCLRKDNDQNLELSILSENANQNFNSSVQADHSYAANLQIFRMEENYKKILLNNSKLNSCVKENVHFYVLNCKTLFEHVHSLNVNRFLFYIELDDLLTLQEHNWLSNFIVDAALTAILYDQNDPRLESLPCQLDQYYANNEELIKSALESSSSTLIVPHCYKKHFYILFIDKIRLEFMFLDPMGKSQTAQKFIRYYKELLERISKMNYICVSKTHDLQNDQYNCGIFILQFAKCYINDMPLLNLQSARLFRRGMFEKLINYGDSLVDICLHCCKYIGHKPRLLCNSCGRYICIQCTTNTYTINDNTLTCKLCEASMR